MQLKCAKGPSGTGSIVAVGCFDGSVHPTHLAVVCYIFVLRYVHKYISNLILSFFFTGTVRVLSDPFALGTPAEVKWVT